MPSDPGIHTIQIYGYPKFPSVISVGYFLDENFKLVRNFFAQSPVFLGLFEIEWLVRVSDDAHNPILLKVLIKYSPPPSLPLSLPSLPSLLPSMFYWC